MTRKKISDNIEAQVMFKSDRKCCVCDKRGDHIHHIDGDNSNSKFENLALLCFDCHNEATMTGSLRKKLSAETIILYRDQKYASMQAKRDSSVSVFNVPIEGMAAEDFLTISKNALIIIEIEKIKEEYGSVDWDKRADVLGKLYKFQDHKNFRIAYDVFNFLELVADQTRAGMTEDVASTILSLILNFFPYSKDEDKKEQTIELGSQCVDIGFSIVYDSAIYLKNYILPMHGLSILKYIYGKAQHQKLQKLIDKINETYDEILSQLNRKERDDLKNQIELANIFRADIQKGTLAWPPLSDNLYKLVYPKG
jgi:hypothetical protein